MKLSNWKKLGAPALAVVLGLAAVQSANADWKSWLKDHAHKAGEKVHVLKQKIVDKFDGDDVIEAEEDEDGNSKAVNRGGNDKLQDNHAIALQNAEMRVNASSKKKPVDPNAEAPGLGRAVYDGGPLLNSSDEFEKKMGQELDEIVSSIPFFPGISNEIMGYQKFRPAFGPIPWRMMQKPNSVKILFIGQDGTHIAEAAGRPATAGFGGRAQDLAKYFGVSESAAFINTFAFTIQGQYGVANRPALVLDPKTKKWGVKDRNVVDNQLWLMSQSEKSPIVQWRNKLISWIIRNNKDSLQMIVTFGGGARDAAAVFVKSKGGTVAPKYPDALKTTRVPEMKLVSAGGNNQAAVVLTKDGGDAFAKLAKVKMNPKDEKSVADAHTKLDNAVFADQSLIDQFMISPTADGSGLLDAAQIGGYDIDKHMAADGKNNSISLSGLNVDGFEIKRDILLVQLPHPTSLSANEMEKPGSAKVAVDQKLEQVKVFRDTKGWKIKADKGLTNSFDAKEEYEYGRAHMGPEYYDFGAPASRMVDVSTAARDGANTIIFGTRDKPKLDEKARQAIIKSKPSSLPNKGDMWTTRPRLSNSRKAGFDPGPGEKYATLMKKFITEEIAGMDDVNHDFGHYRGDLANVKSAKVVILADPSGWDDLDTSRALTGTRGQYLNGLMNDLGVGTEFVIIKTAPFGEAKNWDDIYKATGEYRKAIIAEIKKDAPKAVFASDGEYAEKALTEILGAGKFVAIARGKTLDAGIVDAAKGFASVGLKGTASGKMLDCDRSHLSYYARIWECRGGDHVLNSIDGKNAFALVAPDWAVKQAYEMPKSDTDGIAALKALAAKAKIQMPAKGSVSAKDDGDDQQ